jgi:hypothetical protein
MQAPPQAVQRVDFLDRIRVILTLLVVLHHSAIMFGGEGGWYLRYRADGQAAEIMLTLLCAVDQSFFMGAFFLLAGYFTPGSLAGKGLPRFVTDRLLRLGVPLLLYGFLLGPLTLALADAPDAARLLPAWGQLLGRATFNLGPLWFAWALLLFSGLWLLLRAPIARTLPAARAPSHLAIFFIILLWGSGAFALRLWLPTGHERWGLQIGFFASYLLLFALGCAAAPLRLLGSIEPALARPWAWVSLFSIPTLFVYAYLAGAFRGVPFELHGGTTLPALAYAFWEALVGGGIILWLLWRMRSMARPAPLWARLAPLCYAAFIVHPPLVVLAGRMLGPLALPSLAKFAIGGLFAVLASFAVAAGLIRLPGARRIL